MAEDLTDKEIARRIAALMGDSGEDVAGTNREPTADEIDTMLEELVKAAEDVPKAVEDADLDRGIGAVAWRMQVSVEEVIGVLDGAEGDEAAWEAMVMVLEAAMGDVAWLAQPEGRGGRPLSLEEAGLDRHERAAGKQVESAGRGGAGGSSRHWWSRK